VGQHAAYIGRAAQAGVLGGILGGTADGGIHFGHEFIAQTGLLLVIPDRGIGQVSFRLRPDDDAVAHDPSFAWMRALT